MGNFLFRVPPVIDFGWGRRDSVGTAVAQFGSRCVIVTTERLHQNTPMIEAMQRRLHESHVLSTVYDGVKPNPTVDMMDSGAAVAQSFRADVILGVGGGSAMDAAKAVALGATNPGSTWDYRLFGERKISNRVLPVVTVGTTAGTGSHVSPVSVLTNSDLNSKFAIVDYRLSPVWAIVDPELTLSVPPHVTAATGFDVFAHAFESTLHPNASPFVNLAAERALRLVAQFLPRAVQDGNDVEARIAMAEADTLAGICITNAGTTLPHGIAMAIGGHAPRVMHGAALAAVYPAVMRFTWADAITQFSHLYQILRNSPVLADGDPEQASRAVDLVEDFLAQIGLADTVDKLGIDSDILAAIVKDTFALPDYSVNPKVPSMDDVRDILSAGSTTVG